MRIQVYDSAYHAAEANYPGRFIMWGISAETGGPVCLNLVGYFVEAFVELPITAKGAAKVDWGATAPGLSRILREKAIGILRGALGDDSCAEVLLVERYKYLGYHEAKNHYLRVRCEKRETLDAVIKQAREQLTDLFGGAAPEWRETEIDPMAKLFVERGWNRSGWFEIPDVYTPLLDPLEDVTVRGVQTARGSGGLPLRWIDTTSPRRPVEHVYLSASIEAGKAEIRHIADLSELHGARADPVILYFDFETYRGSLAGFPEASVPSDMIYMCSIVVANLGGLATERRKYCICVGDPDRALLAGVTVMSAQDEGELYELFGQVIRTENPEVISGYNIHGFDLKYMEKRLALWGQEGPDVSRLPGKRSCFDLLRGPRGSRYTNLKCPGRIVMDLFLYLIKSTSRQELSSFDLKSVSGYYLRAPELPEIVASLFVDIASEGSTVLWTSVLNYGTETTVRAGRLESVDGEGEAYARAVGSLYDTLAAIRDAKKAVRMTVNSSGTLAPAEIARCAAGAGGITVREVRWKGADAAGKWEMAPQKAQTKIDLSYKDQFVLYLRYLLGFPDGPAGLGRIAEYCVRDSDILPDLFENRAIWQTCTQFSNILGCTIQTVAVAGQVERLTPLLYRYTRGRDTVIEVNPDAGKIHFEGGFVHLSAPGLHHGVCIGDFASLYPSLIISLNLCMTTRVRERDTGQLCRALKPEQYHICEVAYKMDEEAAKGDGTEPPPDLEGEEAGTDGALDTLVEGAQDDPSGSDESDELDEEERERQSRSAVRKAKIAMARAGAQISREEKIMFVAADVRKGIIPQAVAELLAERARIRKEVMPALERKAKECLDAGDMAGAKNFKQQADDADKRQLAAKEAANSTFGFMGATAPHADPFVGMVTTAEGRLVIKRSTDLIVDAKPKDRSHVYTDTDSSMITDRAFARLPSRCLRNPPAVVIEDLGCDPDSLPTWYADSLTDLLKDWAKTLWDLEKKCVIPLIKETCTEICSIPDRSGIYKRPMKFEYEGFVMSGMWFKKKFYIAWVLTDEGKITLKQRGVLLRRGDYPQIVKDIYAQACFGLLDGKPIREIVAGVAAGIRRILVGPELVFEECRISSDYKSVTEYKGMCKMLELALRAEKMGVPLQENSRIDTVMLAPRGQRLARESIMLETGGNSKHLATRAMRDMLEGVPDRDHYFKVLVSHVDGLIACALGPAAGRIAYIMDKARAEKYADPARLGELDNFVKVTRAPCRTCGKLMTVHVGGTTGGCVRIIGAAGFRLSQGCLATPKRCQTRDPPAAGSVPLRSLARLTWDMGAPLRSFLAVYTATLRAKPEEGILAARERALADLAHAVRLY
jgi:DNA polymerase elongation subunit (family B)